VKFAQAGCSGKRDETCIVLCQQSILKQFARSIAALMSVLEL